MAEKTRILVLGATGYIGGSVVTELLKAKDQPYTLSALVRKPEQVEKLKDVGVQGIVFNSLDDFDAIRAAAKGSDIVIAAASARHAGSAEACIEGLAAAGKASGIDVHYIHISGTSMLGDWPETGERVDTAIHSDVDEDIYTIEKTFPEKHSPVRAVNQLVVDLGEKEGVKTYIVPAPLIFGRGTGLFSEGIGQIHMMTQLSLKKKQAVIIGSGSGIWNRVYITDLANLFSLLVESILAKKEIPFGKKGYYFAENGFQSWGSIAEGIGKAGHGIGVFESSHVGKISLEEVAGEFFSGDLRDAEGVLASNSRTRADRARQILGWNPKHGGDAFEQEIVDVVLSMSKKEQSDHTFR